MQSETQDEMLATYQKTMLQTVAYKYIRETIGSTLKTFKLNTSQWMIMGILRDSKEGQTASKIASMMQVEVPLITTLSQPLLAMGCIEQTTSEQDRRSKPLIITEGGEILTSRVEQAIAEDLKLLEANISQADLTQYFATLRQFIVNGQRLSTRS
ncbi:hypothetical protein BH09PAT3_BH09PAT3_5780 [soil metagenome]